jgi:hypothetical protein
MRIASFHGTLRQKTYINLWHIPLGWGANRFAPQPTRARHVYIKPLVPIELKFCNDFTKEKNMNAYKDPYNWLSAIVENKKISLDEPDSCISFYGNENSTYMVVERFTSDTSADQFVVDSVEDGHSLKAILLLLAQVDYDARKLLDWLDSRAYAKDDMGDVYRDEGLSVVKKTISQD